MNLANLSAFWELEEASGTRFDLHGTNHLTDNNTVTSNTGKVATAAQFTRVNSEFLSVADNPALSMGDIDFSITAWVYFDSVTANDQVIVAKGDIGSYITGEFSVEVGTGPRARIYVGNGSVSSNATVTSPTFTTATWYFVFAFHDSVANLIGISVNDGTVVTVAHSTGSYDSALELTIGSWPTSHSGFHNGRIDQVGVWKRRLTVAEVTALYNSGNGLSYVAMGGVIKRPAVNNWAVMRAATW